MFCVHAVLTDLWMVLIFSSLIFPVFLGAASQRIEYLALELIGTPWMLEVLADWKLRERGAIPGPTELCIMIFVISKLGASRFTHFLLNWLIDMFIGLINAEIKTLFSSGILDYLGDLWNIIDFISNFFYVTWIGLRITSWYVVQVSAHNRMWIVWAAIWFEFSRLCCDSETFKPDWMHIIRANNGTHSIRCWCPKVYLLPVWYSRFSNWFTFFR